MGSARNVPIEFSLVTFLNVLYMCILVVQSFQQPALIWGTINLAFVLLSTAIISIFFLLITYNGERDKQRNSQSHMGSNIKMNRKIRTVETPYVYILILTVIVAGAYFVVLNTNGNNTEIRAWLRSISVGLGGAYLVFILVDRVFRNKEENERIRIQTTALIHLRLPFRSHIQILLYWFIASSSVVPAKIPDQYRQLFDKNYVERIKWLDFSEDSPLYTIDSSEDYISYSANNMKELTDSIDSTMAQYGSHLDPELVENLQNLSESKLINFIVQLNENREVIGSAQEEIGHAFEPNILAQEDLIKPEGFTKVIEKHLDVIMFLLSYYDSHPNVDFDSVNGFDVWDENVNPKVGSARVEFPYVFSAVST